MQFDLIPDEIDAYAAAHTDAPAPMFQELAEETHTEMYCPEMQVGRIEGTFLKILVKLARARRVLELGMYTGYSALMMAEGLPDDGELITCDVDPDAERIARRYFERSPHGKKIIIRMGPALATMKTLSPSFDLIFIDADKENYCNYYESALPLLRSNGLIVADNTLWRGRVTHPGDDADRALAAFNDHVAADPRVDKVLLTVRDGMTLVLKK